jgi:hypothetical protein
MVALLAVAAAAGVPFVSGGAAPAYAVSTNDDGTVTVEISSLSDAAGLQSKLREAGVRAVVHYLPPGKACKQPWFAAAPAEGGPAAQGSTPAIKGGVEQTSDGHTRFTVSKSLGADETLMIMTQVAPEGSGPSGAPSPTAIAVGIARGEVKPCEVVDAPAGSEPLGGPPPGAGKVHTEDGGLGPALSTSGAGSAANDGSGGAASN